MASTEIRVNLLFEDNISTVTRRLGSLRRSLAKLNFTLGQLKNSGDGIKLDISLEGADKTLEQLREINKMLKSLKAYREIKIRVTFEQSDLARTKNVPVVPSQRGRTAINRGGKVVGTSNITPAILDRVKSVTDRLGQAGLSYLTSGIRFINFELPRTVIGFAKNYFTRLVEYQRRAYAWMYGVTKQGIDFLRNNVIGWIKNGVQTITNVGRTLIQVPFKYIGGAFLRGITGFYSGSVKLFTKMLQAPFRVLRTAGNVFNEIDRWFRHVSQTFYYVSMTFAYISRTAGLLAGVLVGAVTKIFETFKTAVQEQYKIAVTTGIVATPTGVAGLQGNYAADVRNKMSVLTKIAYQINQRSGAALSDVVDLLYFISSSGFKQTEELKNVTQAVSAISFATGSDPVALFRSLISVMGAEGLEPTEKNINTTLAKIVYAVSEGVFEMGELATQLQRVAAFSEAANTSFEETLSIMAALSKGGLKPETIGTGLSQVFAQLNKPQTQEKMRRYMGIVPIKFEEGIMQQQSIMEIVETLVPSELLRRVKSGELTAADREMLKQIAKQSAVMMGFEKRAQTAWLTMFNKLDDVYKMLREFEGMQAVPGLLEKYLAYFKEIPNATMLATLNRISGAIEYLKTTVLNALMNKLGENITTIESWFRQVADKIASLIENTNIIERIAELIKSIIKLIIDLIRATLVFGVLATVARLMAAFTELFRPTLLLLLGFVRGFKNALEKQGRGDFSNVVQGYVELMIKVGEKLGEFFAMLFEAVEGFLNTKKQLEEAGKTSGEAVGQASVDTAINVAAQVADAAAAAVKWVNDFTAAFIQRFNEKKAEMTEHVKNILLNIFSFDLDFFNIALKFVEAFVGGLKQALMISWNVMNAVAEVERNRRESVPRRKLLSELTTNAEIDEYVEEVRKRTTERLIERGIYKTEDEMTAATKQSIANFAKSYVLFAQQVPNTIKNVIIDAIEASVFGMDIGLKLLVKILDGLISGLNGIIDKMLKGEYDELFKDIQSDTAQFLKKIGIAFVDAAIIGFTIAGNLMAGAFEGMKQLAEWYESPETKKYRDALGEAVKNFFVNSLKFAIRGTEFVAEVLNTILPALSEGLDEIVKYLENPQMQTKLEKTLTQLMTNVVIFAGKTIKLLLTAFPIFAKAFVEAMTGDGPKQFKKEDVMSKWGGVIQTLRDYLPTAIGGLIDILVFALTLIDDVIVQFEAALKKNQDKMVVLFTKIFEVMFDIVKTKTEVLKAAAKGFATVLKNALIPGTEEFEKFKEFKGTVEDIGKTFGESTANLFAVFIEVGGAWIKGIAEGLRKADLSVLRQALHDVLKDSITSAISFTSFGLDVAVELLTRIYDWLNVVLELFRVTNDQKMWEQFKKTRKLGTIEFSEGDIKDIENIKSRLGQLKLIIPGLTIELGAAWWGIVDQITSALSDQFTAISLYKFNLPYTQQLPEFKKYIKEQDFKNFETMVKNMTQSLSNAITILLQAPITVSKVTLKALEIAFDSVDEKTKLKMIASLAGALSGGIVAVTTHSVGLGFTVGVAITFIVEEIAKFVIEKGEEIAKAILNVLKNVWAMALGGALIGFAVGGGPGGLIGVTIGLGISFVLNFADSVDKAKQQIEERAKKVQEKLNATLAIPKGVSGKYSEYRTYFQAVENQIKAKKGKDKRYSGLGEFTEYFFKDSDSLPGYLKQAVEFFVLRSASKPGYISSDAVKSFVNNVTKRPQEFKEVMSRVDLWYTPGLDDILNPLAAADPTSLLNMRGEIPDWFRTKIKAAAENKFSADSVKDFLSAAQINLEFLPYYVVMRKLKELQNITDISKRTSELTKYLNDPNGFKREVDTAIANYKKFIETLVETELLNVKSLNPEELRTIHENLLYSIRNMQAKYATGGYTGDGGKFEPAGIVHKGEYVIPQWMVRKYPGTIAALEKIRKRGYSEGGAVDFKLVTGFASASGFSLSLQRTLADAIEDLGDTIGKLSSIISETAEELEIDSIFKAFSSETSAKDIAQAYRNVYDALGGTAKNALGFIGDGVDVLKKISADLDEISNQVFGIRKEIEKAPGGPVTETATTAQGKRVTEITANVKETLIGAIASLFLGQEAGATFANMILPFFKNLRGSELKHTVETQDEIKKYKLSDLGIPGLGEIADIVLSFGNWADKLVSDEMLQQYRSMYIYPAQPGGIAGGEGRTETIGDKLISFLNQLQNFRPFGMFENLPAVGSLFAAVDNVFGMLGGALPGIVKNLITFVYSLESVQAAFSPVNTIIQAATEVLKPFIDDAMQPLIQVWRDIGRYIGAALVPIVQIFGAVLKMLMIVLQPVLDAVRIAGKVVFIVGKIVLMVVTKIANAIIDVFNFVIGVINSALGWLGIKLSTLQKLQEESLEDILKQAEEIFGSTTLGASSGGSGSVGVTSKAENVTYNNYITVSFEDMVIADKEELKRLIIDSLKELGLSVGK